MIQNRVVTIDKLFMFLSGGTVSSREEVGEDLNAFGQIMSSRNRVSHGSFGETGLG